MRTGTAGLVCCVLLTVMGSDAHAAGIRATFGPSYDRVKEAKVAAEMLKLNVPRLDARPRIDGKATDAAWREAAVITRFTRSSPRTRAMIGCDDKALYVAVVCENAPGQAPIGAARRRDFRTWLDDCVDLRISPRKTGPTYIFILNCKGAIYDGRGAASTYNPEWSHAVSETPKAWTAEIAIPFAALGLEGPVAELGFNVGRDGPKLAARSWGRDFHSASGSRLALRGVTARADEKGAAERGDSPLVSVSGAGLRCEMERTSVRPGERWVRMTLRLKPVAILSRCRLTASLFAPERTQSIEQQTFTPTHERCVLEVDMRRHALPGARLRVQFEEKGRVTGVVGAFLSARSAERVFAEGEKVPVLLDVPKAARGVAVWPVTVGVPFACGELWSDEGLCLADDAGAVAPFQKEVTGRWADGGAVQWVRFDALVNPSRKYFVVKRPGTVPSSGPALALREQGDTVVVDTGASRYVLGKGVSPVREIHVGGRRVASSQGVRGLYVVDQKGRQARATAKGETMRVEARGPVASCVRFEGGYVTPDGVELARHITRVECFAGQPFAKISHTLILTHDTNKVWLREVGWELQVAPGAAPRALFGLSQGDARKTRQVPLTGANMSAFMFQDSHYRFGHGKNHFYVASVQGRARPKSVFEGEECGDWGALAGAGGGLMWNCYDAAKTHPKEFEAAPGRLTLKLFSNRAGEEMDFRTATLMKMWDVDHWFPKISYKPKFTLKEFKRRFSAYRSNAIGWARTHQLTLSPLPAASPTTTAARVSALQAEPVLAQASPAWFHRAEVLGKLQPADPKRFPALEKLADAAFKKWIQRDALWGHFGFIYYGVGPNMAYSRPPYAMMRRYRVTTYTYRTGVWRQGIRSRDRTLLRFAEQLTRAQADVGYAHRDAGELVHGMFRAPAWPQLPIYWGGRGYMQHGSATDLDRYVWHYQITGDRRLKDFVEEWADGAKQLWTVARAKRSWRILMAFRQISQAYAFTFDPALRDLASATADIFEDPDGELLLTKERSYHSTTYKTQVDIRGILDAWRIFGEERYHEMALRIARFWWPVYLTASPLGYNVPVSTLGAFLYDETGNPAYAQGTKFFLRRTAALAPKEFRCCSKMAPLTDAGIGLDAITRAGADRADVASWFHFADPVDPATLILHKDDGASVELQYKSAGRLYLRPLNAPNTWGLDTLRDDANIRGERGQGVARLPKDANECDYEVGFSKQGKHVVLANGRHRMVLYAPGYWYPAPTTTPQTRYYFRVPPKSRRPRIYFEGSAKLFTPEGTPFGGKAVSGWADLPASRPGLWSFEPVDNKLVRVAGLPPFFSAGNPKAFYVPDIKWETKAAMALGEKPSPKQVFVAGASGTEGDQGLYLTGKRHLLVRAGPPHASGDGSAFLPRKQGTIEYWLKPYWSSVEMPDGYRFFVMGRMMQGGGSGYFSMKYEKKGQVKQLFVFAQTDGGTGRRGERYRRHDTFFRAGEWVHIALVWGRRDGILVYPTQRKWKDVFIAEVYVNGRRGRVYEKHMSRLNDLASQLREVSIGYFRPAQNLDGVVDELRVSDIERYTSDFTPPPRSVEFRMDKHTRALFHFNGDVKGRSYGTDMPVAAQLRK